MKTICYDLTGMSVLIELTIRVAVRRAFILVFLSDLSVLVVTSIHITKPVF